MGLRVGTRLILGVSLWLGVVGGIAFAGDAERMAEMQKALNDEVLAQPFQVAKPVIKRPAAVESSLPQPQVPRCTARCDSFWRYPRLSFGFHYGHGGHRHYAHRRSLHHHHRYRHFRHH